MPLFSRIFGVALFIAAALCFIVFLLDGLQWAVGPTWPLAWSAIVSLGLALALGWLGARLFRMNEG